MVLTVEQILLAAHVNYEQGIDAPALTEEDGKVRLSMLKQIVSAWATENNTPWAELFTIETLGPIEAGETEYRLPDGFAMPDSFYLPDSVVPVKVKKPWQITGAEGRFIYITGNPADGYVLNLGWTPATGEPEIGKSIRAIIYRDPLLPTKTKDILDMSDPYYAVDELTAELFAPDDQALYDKWHNSALARLANMRERNDRSVVGEDTEDVEVDSPTFGE